MLEEQISSRTTQKFVHIKSGESYEIEHLIQSLQSLHYEFSEYEKPWSYIRKGDSIKICNPKGSSYNLSFWGNELESIHNDSLWTLPELSLSSLQSVFKGGDQDIKLINYLHSEKIFCFLDNLEFHPVYEKLRGLGSINSSFDILGDSIWEKNIICDLGVEWVYCDSLEWFQKILSEKSEKIQIYTRHSKIIREFLDQNNFWHITLTAISTHLLQSFAWENSKKKYIYICDDIISKIFIKRRSRKKLSADVDLLLKIGQGDYVVHIDHGVGIFEWIIKKEIQNIEKEYMHLSYQWNDKLFVPITEVQRVSKYVGSENPSITPLSGKIWEKKMKKIHEDIREIAESLLKNFAERRLRSGKKLLPYHVEMQDFQSRFPYTYTDDQFTAIQDIMQDMQSEKNMDRLIVGDVGFGKTEIAFNAAYQALLNHKQVLFLSPLVVLTHEHYNKALERFKDLEIQIGLLTRLQSQKEASRVIRGLQDGSIDMVIGTHRLLSDTLQCKRLGLMIVDEEHKFGVTDKEKIKNIKSDIDILSLSATPIPRSLNLALAGIRDISLLKTPPGGRKSIETSVCRFNEQVILDAGNREFQRKWQIFFVHNRVSNIEVYKKKLENLFPKKKVIITHGQLPGDELENRILDFKNKKYDILLSTTVIENGIDFSNVNTIFINECQSFGISQIHQLRGRVGRSDTQWYCYLLYRRDHLDSEAAKRIQTIVDYSYLWAGFELAIKDLEIRWGGDILGVRQSGQAKEIWVSLFLKMLEEKIDELKNTWVSNVKKRSNTYIDLNIAASIPDSYFLSETDKLQFYREIELIEEQEDLIYLKRQFFQWETIGTLSESTKNLFLILECQIIAREFYISDIKRVWVNYQIEFHEDTSLDELKTFLRKDVEVLFHVVDAKKIRCPIKGFVNDKKFIEYLTTLMQWNISPRKKNIRLAWKRH